MNKNHEIELDFEGLKRYLIGLGFKVNGNHGRSLVMAHSESNTIVALTVPEDGRSVRPADLLSILIRLEHQGIADEETLEKFRAGKLPLAS